ncbi:conserved hypothetical protein [Burkholderia cenocepacia PC184]|nr:conserved hypothetical protein [Burkholderia cenocepacia PC184]
MDDIVRQALAKWPNVPDCTGWLLLDRRGTWRLRDDAAQAAGELGSPIRYGGCKRVHRRQLRMATRKAGRPSRTGRSAVYVELCLYARGVVRLRRT